MRYLSAEEILAIHDRLIEEIGGSFGIRDENLLRSIPQRPKTSFGGKDQFPTIFLKAASYLEALATYHVFVDGNKRSAITVAGIFLQTNNYTISLPIEESEQFIIRVATEKLPIEEIATWLEQNSREP